MLARRRHDGRGEEGLVDARAAHYDEADNDVARARGDRLARVQQLARVDDQVDCALLNFRCFGLTVFRTKNMSS